MADSLIDLTPKVLNANTTAHEIWPVGPFITGTIQVEAVGRDAWTSAVVKIRRSNNGVTFVDFPSPIQLSADGITPGLDLTGVGWVSIEVTTVNGAALLLNCWGVFKT